MKKIYVTIADLISQDDIRKHGDDFSLEQHRFGMLYGYPGHDNKQLYDVSLAKLISDLNLARAEVVVFYTPDFNHISWGHQNAAQAICRHTKVRSVLLLSAQVTASMLEEGLDCEVREIKLRGKKLHRQWRNVAQEELFPRILGIARKLAHEPIAIERQFQLA